MGMGSFISAVEALPKDTRAILEFGDVPATYEAMTAETLWTQVFNIWYQFSDQLQTDSALQNVNQFNLYARNQWDVRPDGTVGRTLSMQQIREAATSWFTTPQSVSDIETDYQRLTSRTIDLTKILADRENYADDLQDDSVQQIGAIMWRQTLNSFASTYKAFLSDISSYRQMVEKNSKEKMDSIAGLVDSIHDRNHKISDAMSDKTWTRMSVHQYAGSPIVVLGDLPLDWMGLFGQSLLETTITKKHGPFGGSSGEWIIEDAGSYLNEIKQELKGVCQSKKSVKVGRPPSNCDEFEFID